MAKVRDYNAELKALEERARGLKAKRIEQLGQLVAATGADALDLETLAGALLELVGKARSGDAGDTLALWKRRGKRTFDREAERSSTDA